jgi:CrcB protein
MRDYFWIALGGALGSVSRFWLSGLVVQRLGEAFPYGTLLVNIAGCLVIGFFAGITGLDGGFSVHPTARQFVTVGLCGGFTTFSAFSLQTMELARAGAWFSAGLNVSLSVLACLLAAWAGHGLATSLLK